MSLLFTEFTLKYVKMLILFMKTFMNKFFLCQCCDQFFQLIANIVLQLQHKVSHDLILPWNQATRDSTVSI